MLILPEDWAAARLVGRPSSASKVIRAARRSTRNLRTRSNDWGGMAIVCFQTRRMVRAARRGPIRSYRVAGAAPEIWNPQGFTKFYREYFLGLRRGDRRLGDPDLLRGQEHELVLRHKLGTPVVLCASELAPRRRS